MKSSKTPRGPRIRTINIVSVVLTLLIVLLFLFDTQRTYQANRDLNEATEKYVACEMAATALKQGSDNLTTQVRLYTITGDPAYLRTYFAEVATQHREQAVDTLEHYLLDTEAYRFLEDALECSVELMDLEYYAMALVLDATDRQIEPGMEALRDVRLRAEDEALDASGKMDLAFSLMHGKEYLRYDTIIDDDVAQCIEDLSAERETIHSQSQATLARMRTRQNLGAVALAVGILAYVVLTTVYMARPISADVQLIAGDKPLPLKGAYELQYLANAYNAMYEQRREQHVRLEDALEQAQSASNAKTAFLMNMSHDIRTPMNAIIGFTTLARDRAGDAEAVRDYLQKISASSGHLLSLINNVLEMSRIESGQIELCDRECSLQEIVYDVRTIVQADVAAKDIKFSIDVVDVVNENLICDRARLSQVLLNIVSNALKFTPAGGTISVCIRQLGSAEQGYAAYEFKISDTGIGMSREFKEHLFEAFSRERTSTVSGLEGVGLGLAITKNIIDLMSGEIAVESEEGKGTEFTITLPLRLGTAARRTEALLESEGPATQELSFSGRRILLVEDNEINQQIAQMILEKSGFEVDVANDGTVAVEKVRGAAPGQYDLVLMDIQMPIMNGYEATRQIRALDSPLAGIPIIALSANALEEDKRNSLESGMNSHVGKPFDVQQLLELLQSYLK